MRKFIDFLNEAKFEPGGPDLSKLFGKRGQFRPDSPDAPKEPTAHQRLKAAAKQTQMPRGAFNAMIQGIFGPPKGDVPEAKTQSNMDRLRGALRDAGKTVKGKVKKKSHQRKRNQSVHLVASHHHMKL